MTPNELADALSDEAMLASKRAVVLRALPYRGKAAILRDTVADELDLQSERLIRMFAMALPDDPIAEPAADVDAVRLLACSVGLRYKAGESCTLGNTFYAFTKNELQEFARRLAQPSESGVIDSDANRDASIIEEMASEFLETGTQRWVEMYDIARLHRIYGRRAAAAASGISIDELLVAQAKDDPVFSAWRDSVPDKHWAKLDLSALRIGYELGRRLAQPQRLDPSDWCALQGCIHKAHGSPTWKDGQNPFVQPQRQGRAVAYVHPECLERLATTGEEAIYAESYEDCIPIYTEQPASASVDVDQFADDAWIAFQDIGGGRNPTKNNLRAAIVAAFRFAQPASAAVAPWPDFLGQPIRHGDRLVHPDATEFVAIRLDGSDETESWVAVYDLNHMARLSLQIGEKGRAVLAAAPDRSKEVDHG